MIRKNAPFLRENLNKKYHHFFDMLVDAACASPAPATPISRPLGGDDLQMVFRALTFAGYDKAKVHPACYDRFSYTDFVYALETEFAVRGIPSAAPCSMPAVPTEAMQEAFKASWNEITMPAQGWPDRLLRAYAAMRAVAPTSPPSVAASTDALVSLLKDIRSDMSWHPFNDLAKRLSSRIDEVLASSPPSFIEDTRPGTPLARLAFVQELAEKYCGHSLTSSEPAELAIERALRMRSTVAASTEPGLVRDLRNMASAGWALRYEHDGTLAEAANTIERLEQRVNQLEASRNALSSPSSSIAAITERAWLIEMPAARHGTGYFWTGVSQYNEWGTIDKAVRFCRKADAERVIETLKQSRPYRKIDLEACEHEWPATSPQSAIQATTLRWIADNAEAHPEVVDEVVRRAEEALVTQPRRTFADWWDDYGRAKYQELPIRDPLHAAKLGWEAASTPISEAK